MFQLRFHLSEYALNCINMVKLAPVYVWIGRGITKPHIQPTLVADLVPSLSMFKKAADIEFSY